MVAWSDEPESPDKADIHLAVRRVFNLQEIRHLIVAPQEPRVSYSILVTGYTAAMRLSGSLGENNQTDMDFRVAYGVIQVPTGDNIEAFGSCV